MTTTYLKSRLRERSARIGSRIKATAAEPGTMEPEHRKRRASQFEWHQPASTTSLNYLDPRTHPTNLSGMERPPQVELHQPASTSRNDLDLRIHSTNLSAMERPLLPDLEFKPWFPPIESDFRQPGSKTDRNDTGSDQLHSVPFITSRLLLPETLFGSALPPIQYESRQPVSESDRTDSEPLELFHSTSSINPPNMERLLHPDITFELLLPTITMDHLFEELDIISPLLEKFQLLDNIRNIRVAVGYDVLAENSDKDFGLHPFHATGGNLSSRRPRG